MHKEALRVRSSNFLYHCDGKLRNAEIQVVAKCPVPLRNKKRPWNRPRGGGGGGVMSSQVRRTPSPKREEFNAVKMLSLTVTKPSTVLLHSNGTRKSLLNPSKYSHIWETFFQAKINRFRTRFRFHAFQMVMDASLRKKDIFKVAENLSSLYLLRHNLAWGPPS